jgi:hypothetical protein
VRRKTVRNPENYHPAKHVAAALRRIADGLEHDTKYVNYSIQFWFASQTDVERARLKQFAHASTPDSK